MNIKEHIEAGHYPKDEKGRALVPMSDGTAVILMTDCPDRGRPILGYRLRTDYICEVLTWKECGEHYGGNYDLLPPSPRKVEVKGYALVARDGRVAEVRTVIPDHLAVSQFLVVPLTGSYEEPWS